MSANIETLIRRERYRAAQQALDEQLAEDGPKDQPTACLEPPTRTPGSTRFALPEGSRPELELLRARLEISRGGVALDEVIFRLEELCASGALARDPHGAGYALELIAACYVRKRLPDLARETVARVRAGGADRPGLHAVEAEIALVEDDRAAARAAFERARALDPALGAARLGFGQLLYVMNDFAAAEAELARVPLESRHWGAAMRVRAAIAGARADHQREAQVWRALLDCRPDGDNAQTDRIGLGLCLAALGQRVPALDAFRAAWQLAPQSMHGRYARERMTHLESAPSGAGRVELEAFPTTAQKWNYCGPAVLELVLRYFDFEADQDAIAGVVKREHGTPMFEIVGYLAQMGVEARRVEASRARIKRAIDLGCPVIVQEEYSSSTHVAVITGYDDALGVFVAQDPMRHQPILKSFTFTEAAGDLFGNGAIAVLGPEAVAAGRRAACDEAGLVECRHLALVDECSRRRRRVHGEGHEELAPGEVVRFCDEAIALAPDFKLAHFLRYRALRMLNVAGSLSHDEVVRDLALHRVRYPDDEWPHALQGAYLMACGRYDEAFVAYLDAHRRDPYDEENLQSMGEARWLAGDLASAEDYLLRALAEAPGAVRAAENLAAVYLRALEAEDEEEPDEEEEDDEDEDDEGDDDEVRYVPDGADGDTVPDAPAHVDDATIDEAIIDVDDEEGDEAEAADDGDGDDDDDDDDDGLGRMPPRVLRTCPAHDRAELVRRAGHFSRVALAAAPGNAFNHLVAGELARHEGRLADAASALRRTLELEPERHGARRSLAAVLEETGNADECEAELAELVRRSSEAPPSHIALARFLRRRGRHRDAADALTRAADLVTHGREELVEPLYAALERLGTAEAAAAQLRAMAERHLGDDDFLTRVVGTLEEEGQRGHALALARQLVDHAPGDPVALWHLARLLDETGLHADEARDCFQRLVELAPDVPAGRVRLAWLLLPDDPAAALAAVEPVLASEDRDAYDVQSACLEALGKKRQAERALARAVQGASDPALGLVALIARHTQADRHERACQLAARLDLDALEELDDDDRELIETAWLAAYRMAGRAREILPRVLALCESGVPAHLAFEVHHAFSALDRGLAMSAAEVEAENADDPAERAQWRITAAGLRAVLTGDSRKLDALARRVPPHASAWAELASAYAELERYGDADRAAARAFDLDPLAESAFVERVHSLERQNRLDEAIACAEEFAAARPFEHQGPELLGILLSKVGRVDEALTQSERALDAAPYCHVSQMSRALALFMAGQYAGALDLARRSSASDPTAPDDDGSGDAELLIAALTGDVAGLERGLAGLEKREPGVYPLYRERLRVAAAAHAARA